MKEKSRSSPDSGDLWRNTPYLLMGNKVQSPYLLPQPVSVPGGGAGGSPCSLPSVPRSRQHVWEGWHLGRVFVKENARVIPLPTQSNSSPHQDGT